jgi:hypothetical protein
MTARIVDGNYGSQASSVREDGDLGLNCCLVAQVTYLPKERRRTVCIEMTKAIDRWENEGGRTDDLPLTVCPDSSAMPRYPLRGEPFFDGVASRRDD